jgi:DegV family protein with EDD domain
LGVVDTLEHLQKGGRIGGARALLGSILSIKPVIQVKDGVVAEESKQRTRSRSIDYLAAKVRTFGPLDRLAIVDGAANDLNLLTDQLADLEVAHDVLTVDLGPVVGTHAGPGTLGVCLQLTPGSPAVDG